LELPVSIITAPSVFRALVDSQIEATRDGFLIRDINSHHVGVATAFCDEGQLLAVLETICGILRARGATVTPKMKAAISMDRFRPTEGLRVDPLPPTAEKAPEKAAAEVVLPVTVPTATKAPKGRSKRG
jgi:hypothetical protein